MAEKNYPVNEAIQVTYQADKAATGKTVTMEIFLPGGTKDEVNFPDVTMTELSTTGRYVGSFTPDAQGEWIIMCHAEGKGQTVKQYSVGTHNISDVGEAVDGMDGKLDDVVAAVDDLSSPAMIG